MRGEYLAEREKNQALQKKQAELEQEVGALKKRQAEAEHQLSSEQTKAEEQRRREQTARNQKLEAEEKLAKLERESEEEKSQLQLKFEQERQRLQEEFAGEKQQLQKEFEQQRVQIEAKQLVVEDLQTKLAELEKITKERAFHPSRSIHEEEQPEFLVDDEDEEGDSDFMNASSPMIFRTAKKDNFGFLSTSMSSEGSPSNFRQKERELEDLTRMNGTPLPRSFNPP